MEEEREREREAAAAAGGKRRETRRERERERERESQSEETHNVAHIMYQRPKVRRVLLAQLQSQSLSLPLSQLAAA